MKVKDRRLLVRGEVICYNENADTFLVRAFNNNEFYICDRQDCVCIDDEGQEPSKTCPENPLTDRVIKKDSFLVRLGAEKDELQERIEKLSKALASEGFKEKVGEYQFDLMRAQMKYMADYLHVLGMRIIDLLIKNEHEQAEENKTDTSVRKL